MLPVPEAGGVRRTGTVFYLAHHHHHRHSLVALSLSTESCSMVVVARCRWPLTEGLVWEYYLYLYLPKTAQDYLSYLLLVADTDTTTDDRVRGRGRGRSMRDERPSDEMILEDSLEVGRRRAAAAAVESGNGMWDVRAVGCGGY
jgi:hypothetical protein